MKDRISLFVDITKICLMEKILWPWGTRYFYFRQISTKNDWSKIS